MTLKVRLVSSIEKQQTVSLNYISFNKILENTCTEFMLNKDAGFQSATSLKTKLLYKYFSKLFPKFLEQVLKRTPLRGCCGIKILKFLFVNALSLVKKTVKRRKCLREILDIYVSYPFTVPFVVVYLIPAVCWRLKFGIIFKCSSNILRIYWFLVNFTKVMKYET